MRCIRFQYFAVELRFGTELSSSTLLKVSLQLDTVLLTVIVSAHKAQTCAADEDRNVRAALVLLHCAVTDLCLSRRYCPP